MSINDYSKAEIILSDFSKKIPAYLPEMKIPESLNEEQVLLLLQKKYPDQSRVKFITDNFQVRVRSLNAQFYSLMLCSKNGKQKKMEDISCTLGKVDYRFWETDESSQPECKFEVNWTSHCR